MHLWDITNCGSKRYLQVLSVFTTSVEHLEKLRIRIIA